MTTIEIIEEEFILTKEMEEELSNCKGDIPSQPPKQEGDEE